MLDYSFPSIDYVFTGAGDYDFAWQQDLEEDVTVVHTDSSGITTTLSYGDDYSVTLNASPLVGGTVTIITVAITGGSINLRRKVANSQLVNLTNAGEFSLELIERAMDRIVMQIQEISVILTDGYAVTTWRGDWATSTLYYKSDIVIGPDQNWYYCTVQHTSGVWADDLSAGYFMFALDFQTVRDLTAEAEGYRDEAALSATAASDAATATANDVIQTAADVVTCDADVVACEAARDIAVAAAGGAVGVPVGTVVFVIPGYFTNGSNGGFTSSLNTVALLNAEYNSLGWYCCNGAACNVAGSPFYDGAGRYLPNITDSRWIRGYTTAGAIGGSNTDSHSHTLAHTHSMAHTHTTGNVTLGTTQIPPHYHGSSATTSSDTRARGTDAYTAAAAGSNTGTTGGGSYHNHGTTSASSASSTGAASTANTGAVVTSNEPQFINGIAMQRVI